MTIYNINFGIGWASSGVEYAQAYRAKLLRRTNQDTKFVFLDFIQSENIQTLTQNIGFEDQEVIWLYQYFSDISIAPTTYTLDDIERELGQAVLQHKGDSKVGVVIHADHYSNNMMSEQHILWNNYYEYQFSKAKYIDFFITATDIQNHMVCRQFEQYQGYRPRVYTIPVGSIDALSYPTLSRKPYAMISASRLANEKHIDWLVKAVIVAKRQVPELTFDIYGEGSEKTRLRKIIDTHRAQDYIRLLGHVKLDEIYTDYELFLSASTSEGFGLTLMEAVGSGLGMIGLNVNYGNPTFIRDGENGYLVPFDTDEDSVDDVVAKLAHAIVMYFNNGPQTPHYISYEVAQQFMTQDIILKWETLVQEVLHD